MLRACHLKVLTDVTRNLERLKGNGTRGACMTDALAANQPLLAVKDLRVHFRFVATTWPWTPTRFLKAVDGVSFELRAGET